MSVTNDKRLLKQAAISIGLAIPKGYRWAVPTWGPAARSLVEQYQRARAFPVTGVFDDRLRVDAESVALPTNIKALNIMLQLEKAGVTETTLNRSPAIDAIKLYVNGYTDAAPWCADAVTYCYKKATNGAWPKKDCFNWRYCPSWYEAARTNKCSLRTMTRDIRPGDPVLFDWNGDGVADHIGLVKRAIPGLVNVVAGPPIETVEGNTGATDSGLGFGDGIHSKWRRRSNVMAYIKVDV